MPHIVLFLLIAGEDANLADVRAEETVQDGVAEAAGAAGDEEGLFLNTLIVFVIVFCS